jgi:gluconokinase
MPRRRAEFLILALDVGSSSTRCALFDERGLPIAGTSARAEYSIRYRADGGAELSALQLHRAVLRCVRETLRNRRGSPALRDVPVAAIVGCGFWHSLLGVDRAGEPVTPIYMWADARSAVDAAQLREELGEREVQLRTGCMLRAPYWPAKLRWLRRTQAPLFSRTRRWVSPAQWLFRQLFGAEGTSHSMASGTGLYSLNDGSWHEQLCAACGVNVEQLGIVSDATEARFTDQGVGRRSGLQRDRRRRSRQPRLRS